MVKKVGMSPIPAFFFALRPDTYSVGAIGTEHI